MVVSLTLRFLCVVRVPLCARVSRVCPVCVPAPPGVFLPVTLLSSTLPSCQWHDPEAVGVRSRILLNLNLSREGLINSTGNLW